MKRSQTRPCGLTGSSAGLKWFFYFISFSTTFNTPDDVINDILSLSVTVVLCNITAVHPSTLIVFQLVIFPSNFDKTGDTLGDLNCISCHICQVSLNGALHKLLQKPWINIAVVLVTIPFKQSAAYVFKVACRHKFYCRWWNGSDINGIIS